MSGVMALTFASSLSNLCEVNSSFDSAILRIAYTGENPNRSDISKEAFEKAIKTIYNCPIVCNYDRDSDTLGGHDIELVTSNNGDMKIVNATTPIGVVPESAEVWWQEYVEDDGSVHEYLCTEVLLWKRQEAYSKIKRDGCSAHSMEITVKDGKSIEGVYHVYDFEFTAFCLIGVQPCFAGSALEFAKQDFRQQFSEMMLELKETFTKVNPSLEDDIHPQKYSMEGGEKVLEKKMELIEKYGIDVDKLDFSIDDFSEEELEQKFAAMSGASGDEGTDNGGSDGSSVEPIDGNFALEGNIREEIYRALSAEKVTTEWGDYSRYWFVDYDTEASEVYCWDSNDGLLYGFEYTLNGDSVAINFECKKRKKYVIADFDEGEQTSPFAEMFALMENTIKNNTEFEAKYQSASDTIKSMETELGELRKFKSDTESAIEAEKKDEVFSKFDSLNGVEAYEALKNESDNYDVATLEEKCFAILGRQNVLKFSAEQSKTPKLKVDKTVTNDKAPYGGLFDEYGYGAKN